MRIAVYLTGTSSFWEQSINSVPLYPWIEFVLECEIRIFVPNSHPEFIWMYVHFGQHEKTAQR